MKKQLVLIIALLGCLGGTVQAYHLFNSTINTTCDEETCTHDHETEEGGDCGHDHAEKEHQHTGACNHDHGAPVISHQALKNYKVTFEKLVLDSYVRRTPIQAVVTPVEGTEKVYCMIFSGMIRKVLVTPGDLVSKGEGMIQVLRDPIERPELVAVGNFVRPNVAELLEKVASFNALKAQVTAAQADWDRLVATQESNEFGDLIPRKEMIATQKQLSELKSEIQGVWQFLESFGFCEDEISQITTQTTLSTHHKQWKRALQYNSYWSETADRIFAILPPQLQQDYWSIASLGELVAQGRLPQQVLTILQDSPKMAKDWQDIASLLLQGQDIETIAEWYSLGWLEQKVTILSQNDQAVIADLKVREGQRLEVGTEMVVIQDLSKMQLAFRPIGSEYAWAQRAITQQTALTADPVIQGVGKGLTDLRLDKLFTRDGNVEARITVKNYFLNHKVAILQAGMKYWVYLPSDEVKEQVFVVNTAAVTDFGSDKIMMVKHGTSYEQRKVVVIFQDGGKTILSAKDSDLKEGETYAATGAYRLNLAVQVGQGTLNTDPHAGCSH